MAGMVDSCRFVGGRTPQNQWCSPGALPASSAVTVIGILAYLDSRSLTRRGGTQVLPTPKQR
jgi:hypothetical protein